MKAFFRACLVIALLTLVAACGGTSSAVPTPDAFDGILIAGNADFVAQTRAALELLREKDPAAYANVRAHIGVIEQGEHSGEWSWENPPRYEVGSATAFSSVTWYASTIAHESVHVRLYQEYLQAHPGEQVPDDVYASVDVEISCNAYQLQTLRNLGAPQAETDYLQTLDGTHCDVDHDGDCDIADYQRRNW